MLTCNSKFKDKDLARELDEIHQINKKNHQAQRQLEEEEAKHIQDETLPTHPNEAPMISQAPMDDAINNFASEVRNIMNGVHEMDTSDTEKDNNEELCSPPKKHPTTKTASWHKFTH